MQESVHAQEGKDYDPDAWIRPETVAEAILGVLDLATTRPSRTCRSSRAEVR